jgi:hypothetical protein
MLQLGIAVALMPDAPIVVLDAGLDPDAILKFKECLSAALCSRSDNHGFIARFGRSGPVSL